MASRREALEESATKGCLDFPEEEGKILEVVIQVVFSYNDCIRTNRGVLFLKR